MKVEDGPLAGLEFTPAALDAAREYGHTAEMYDGIEPEGKGGYLLEQVEAVEGGPAAEPDEGEADADADAETEGGEPEADAEPEELPYGIERKGTWKGLPNYGCPHCRFANPRLASVERHVYEHHVIAPPKSPSAIVVTDKRGNVIEPTEE